MTEFKPVDLLVEMLIYEPLYADNGAFQALKSPLEYAFCHLMVHRFSFSTLNSLNDSQHHSSHP